MTNRSSRYRAEQSRFDDTGTEYYDTVFSIAPSALAKGLIWAGTDDGLIQVTRDEGKSWTNVTPKDLPEWSRVSLIEASPHDAGTAYVAIDRHQNDDLKPYVYKTSDYGKTWARIASGIPDGAFVRAVREDPKKKGLLYAGTERGVFVSFDDGSHWRSLQLNLPITPIHDLVVKNSDLVLQRTGARSGSWTMFRRCASSPIPLPARMCISTSQLRRTASTPEKRPAVRYLQGRIRPSEQ